MIELTKEFLEVAYSVNTAGSIAKETGYGVSTILKYLKKFNIKTRKGKQQSIKVSKEQLKELVDKGLSGVQICKTLNISQRQYDFCCQYYGLTGKFIKRVRHTCPECNKVKCFYAVCPRCLGKIKRYNRKLYYIQQFGGCCNRCGYDKCSSALDFHHIDDTQKTEEISRLLYYKSNKQKALLETELKKCELICSNCHRNEHQNKFQSNEAKDLIEKQVM